MNTSTVLVGTAAIVIAVALSLPLMRRILLGPKYFPYTVAVSMRLTGLFLALVWRFKLVPNILEKTSPQLIRCFRSMRASDMFRFRDAYLALDPLPTVIKGKKALGLKSVFDVFSRRVHHLQSPYTHPMQTPPFFVPGVPAQPFYDPMEFDFTARLESSYADIRAELENLLARERSRFRPYAGGQGSIVQGWNNYYFYLFDKKNEENCALCPKTMEVLESIPRLERTMVMFAALNPHAGLEPHTGPGNGILRVHLPLIVPRNCSITVAKQERLWQEGKVMVFDDSFVHQVDNRSDHVRVVLFFSIWHPCLTDEEIPKITAFANSWKEMPVTKLYEEFQHRPHGNNLVMESMSAKPPLSSTAQ